MIKKIFVGVLLAVVFGALIFGAVNRTLAKSANQESRSTNEGSGFGNGNETGSRNLSLEKQTNTSLKLNESRNDGSGSGDCGNQSSQNGSGNNGTQSSGSGNGGSGQGNQGKTSGDYLGEGQADVAAWEDPITVTIDSVTPDLWVVSNEDGFVMNIEGRVLSFLVENGFAVEVGEELILSGFYEGEDFEIGHVMNNSTQQELTIREATGRPLWAGRGQGGTTH